MSENIVKLTCKELAHNAFKKYVTVQSKLKEIAKMTKYGLKMELLIKTIRMQNAKSLR